MNQDQQNASQEPTQPQEQQPITAPDARPPEQLPPENTPVVVRAKNSKKGWLIAGMVLLVALAGAALYWFFLKDSNDSTTSTTVDQTQAQQESSQATQGELTPNTLSYFFRTSTTTGPDIYWRPAAGGDRTKATTLDGYESVIAYDVSGEKVAYVTENYSTRVQRVWMSIDAGKSFSKTLDVAEGAQVTSVKFAVEGSALAVAVLPGADKQNTVKSIDTSTKQAKDLFTAEKAGVFLKGYSTSKQSVIYTEGCYNCDGSVYKNIYQYDLLSKTAKSIVDTGDRVLATSINAVTVDPTFTTVGYVTVKPNYNTMDLGFVSEAPYYAEERSLSGSSSVKVAELGKSGEVDQSTGVGYAQTDSGTKLYFVYGPKVMTTNGTNTTVWFESSKPIVSVYFANPSVIIASSGMYDNFIVTRFEPKTNTATTILNGDANTMIFGVTTN